MTLVNDQPFSEQPFWSNWQVGRGRGRVGGLQSGNRHTASVPLLPASSHSHPFGHSQLELGVNLLSRPDFPSFQPPCIFQQTCRPTLPSHRNKILNPAQSWHLIIPRFYISNCFTEACCFFVCLFFWCMGCWQLHWSIVTVPHCYVELRERKNKSPASMDL